MTLVAVVAAKGAPGATTTSAALAAAGAMRDIPTLLVELDPAGGSLALDSQRSLDPGLLTLMAAARRGIDRTLIEVHSQMLGNGVEVLFAPTSPERARHVVTTLTPGLAGTLANRPELAVVDCGRWDGDEGLIPIVGAADHVLLILRPTLAGTEAARTRLPGLMSINPSGTVICVGDEPYSAHDVAAALGVAVEQPIPHDSRAARMVVAGAPMDRWLRRTPLMRSAAGLIDRIVVNIELEVLV